VRRWALLLLFLSACTEEAVSFDAGRSEDAAAREDATVSPDATPDRDAMTARDAEPRDAVAQDAIAIDAEPRDLGAEDAIVITDAGETSADATALDAEPSDGGAPFVPGDPPEGDPSFVVTDGMMTLLQGAQLVLQMGPQGGFHVFVGARADRALLDPLTPAQRMNLTVSYEIRRASNDELVASGQRTGGWNTTTQTYDSPITLVAFRPDLSPAMVRGQLLRLRASLVLSAVTYSSRVYITTN
jgi:hypothetical protein